MWLPLQLVLEFLGRTAVWLAVMAALGSAAALAVTALARRRLRSAWPALFLAGLAGAVLGASLADRFGLPEALDWRVWRRTIPLAWSAGGALLGAAAAWGITRRRETRAATAGPALPAATPTRPAVPEGSPGEGGAPPPPDAGRPPTADRPEAPRE